MTARRTETNEETPLLQNDSHGHHKRKHSPIPWGQFSIILVLQLAEPLTSQVIFPFAPELVRNIGITDGDETRVGHYVGLLQSIFSATEAMTVLQWSRLSDHLGRKPVIMTGLLGLSVCMYCFGLSRTFWGLLVSRSLTGALNGNIGVMKTMLAEITDPSNIAEAYAFTPIAWSTGAAIGPIIGGSLSRPAERFPSVFGESEFFKKYPYFLPCSIPATFSALVCLLTFVYLEETVSNPPPFRQLLCRSATKSAVEEDHDVSQALAVDDSCRPLPIRRLLVPRVIIAAGNYAFVAIVDIAFRSVQPLFYSTPVEFGGLGLEPRRIGLIMSLCFIANGIVQIFCFRQIHDRFGTQRTYLAGVAGLLPVFALFPLINELARRQGMSVAVWTLVIGQALLSIMNGFSYGCVFIYITASSPNKASLGTVNGIAQMMVSIMRTVGPAIANSLFSLSIDEEHQYMGGHLVYYVLTAITCVAVYVGTFLPEKTMLDEAVPEES